MPQRSRIGSILSLVLTNGLLKRLSIDEVMRCSKLFRTGPCKLRVFLDSRLALHALYSLVLHHRAGAKIRDLVRRSGIKLYIQWTKAYISYTFNEPANMPAEKAEILPSCHQVNKRLFSSSTCLLAKYVGSFSGWASEHTRSSGESPLCDFREICKIDRNGTWCLWWSSSALFRKCKSVSSKIKLQTKENKTKNIWICIKG